MFFKAESLAARPGLALSVIIVITSHLTSLYRSQRTHWGWGWDIQLKGFQLASEESLRKHGTV